MSRLRLPRVPILVTAGLLAAMLAGGAVGVLVGASSVPKINACVRSDGLMRYITSSSCRTGEKLVSWNVQGAKGATGARGPQGPAGPAGGGSGGGGVVQFYLKNGDVITQNSANSAFTVASIKVLAGTYLIDFDGGLYSNDFSSGRCQIDTNPNGDPLADAGGISKANVYGASFGGPIGVRGYAEFTSTTTIYGRCALDAPVVALGQLLVTQAKVLPAVP